MQMPDESWKQSLNTIRTANLQILDESEKQSLKHQQNSQYADARRKLENK
ncbi:MAG: hypothetical protein SO170_01635 [Butyribacter sp.]|nr:hypothetical protein [bacterium]MDY3853654.1 hypothetical protein [Butyribacter sp.]